MRIALFATFLLIARVSFSQISIEADLMLNPENIIRLTYNQNDRIKAAYYELNRQRAILSYLKVNTPSLTH